MKKIFRASLMALLAFGLVSTVYAADIIVPQKQDPNVVVGTSEVHKNLYTVGGNVTVNADVSGDLTAVGGLVSVEGNVEKELLLAGGTLNVNGSIGGTARVAGGNITISGPVDGDLVVAGGNVNITGKASVSGDLLVAGGNVTIDAPVKGFVRVAGGSVTIDSKVGGNVYAQTSRLLVFGPGADVAGTVYHKGVTHAEVRDGAKVGTINFTQLERRGAKQALAGFLTTAFLIRLLAWMLVAFLFYHFKKSWVLQTVEGVHMKPWASLGWGLVFAIAIPVAAVLMLITFVGYYAAFITMAAYVLFLLVAKIFAAMVLGFLIVRLFTKSSENIPMWQPIVIGTVVWSVLSLIPVLGWVVLAVLFLVTFGSLLEVVKAAIR